MSDIFVSFEAVKVLKGKSVLLLGDSIMRNLYKDLVWLCCPGKKGGGLIARVHMLDKGEQSFLGDKLFEKSELTAGRNYVESRDWYSGKEADIQLSFIFITRCYDDRLRSRMENYEKQFGQEEIYR